MSIDFTNPAGKGSQPRPFTDYEQYKNNWDLIFGKKNLGVSDQKKEDNCTDEPTSEN